MGQVKKWITTNDGRKHLITVDKNEKFPGHLDDKYSNWRDEKEAKNKLKSLEQLEKGQFIPTQQDQHIIDARDKTRKQLSRFTDDEQRMLNVWGQKSKSNASMNVVGGDKESNIAPYQRMVNMGLAKHDHKGAYEHNLDLHLVPTTKGRKLAKGYNQGMALLANDPIYLKEFGEKHGNDRIDFHQYVLNTRKLNKQGFY